MKRKGFTLIELLAVIVILAIIALIATPMILNVVEKARIGAVKESGHGYVEAVEKYQLEQQLDSSMYQIPKNTVVNINKCETTCLRDLIEVKGEKPSGNNDYIKLDTKGKIEEGKLTFQGYEVTIKNGNVEDITKGGGLQEEKPDEETFEFMLGIGNTMFAIDSEGTAWYTDVILDSGTLSSTKLKTNNKIKLISGDFAIDIENNLLGLSYVFDSETGLEVMGTIEILTSNKFKYLAAQYAIDVDDNLWLFDLGTNDTGQYIVELKTPIMEGTKFKSIVGGETDYIMAIDSEGNLWGWGNNEYGQLGDGTTTNRTEPVSIKSGTKFKQVSAGYATTVAVDIEGNLWSWGENYLGNGTYASSPVTSPIPIKAGTKFQSVSVGNNYIMAIDSEGNLWGWGSNTSSQLGDGTTERKLSPVQIQKGTKFEQVSSMRYDEYYMLTSAIDKEGNLWMWGKCHKGGNNIIIEPTIVMQLQK